MPEDVQLTAGKGNVWKVVRELGMLPPGPAGSGGLAHGAGYRKV